MKIIRSIREKLADNESMITRADKGSTKVILHTKQYKSKLQDFTDNNEFRICSSNPTQTFQTLTRKTVRNSPTLIPKEHRWKYTNMNPSAPTIKGLVKIHKQNQPIRPVVNWRNAPAYKLSKLFTDKLNHLAPLPNAFNIRNSHDLLHNLENTPITPQHSIVSLDITNLYTNIPIKETKSILNDILAQQHVNNSTKQELLQWYDTITQQNYFAHNKTIYIQQEGLAMGAPSSGLIAEIFLQHTEHTHLARLAQKHRIINYCRYVDDVLIIYDNNHSTILDILQDFNDLHPNLSFTAETEQNQSLNNLDITIHRTTSGLKTSVYRKPTFTDTIIPYTSNHPPAHKFAAIKYLYNRLDMYHMQK
jgi:hypothetical protein